MRGDDEQQAAMFSYVTMAQRIPTGHPVRAIRAMVDRALARMDSELGHLYSTTGRPSIAPERPIGGAMSQRLLESVLEEAREHGLLSEEHLTLDGTPIQAWASARSFKESCL